MNFNLTLDPDQAAHLLQHLRRDGATSKWHRYASKHFYGLIIRSTVSLDDIGPAGLVAAAARIHKKLAKHPDGTPYIAAWTIDIEAGHPAPGLPAGRIRIDTFSSPLVAILEPTLAALYLQDARGGNVGVVQITTN